MNTFAFALCIFVTFVAASSHSEAPGTAKAPGADVTDFYMFQCYEEGKEDHTCFIMNAQPLQNPFGGPNYFTLSDDHFFEIYVDNDGDAIEDITFQFYTGNRLGGDMIEVPFENDEDDCVVYQRSAAPLPLTTMKHGGVTLPIGGRDIAIPLKFFAPIVAGDNSGANWYEWFSLNIIYGDRTFGDKVPITMMGSEETEFPKPLDYAGTKTFPDYPAYAAQYIHTLDIPECGAARAFLGQRKEPFYISIGAIFDLVNLIPIPGFIEESNENNDLSVVNISSFVLEVPTSCLVREEERGVIGAWTGVRKLHHSGEEHVAGKQVSRLGMPLVNELFIGLRDKGRFNNIEPREDMDFVVEYIQYPTLPALINILFLDGVNSILDSSFTTIAPTNLPRMDLYHTFLTGIPGVNHPVNENAVPSDMLRLNTSIPVRPSAEQNQYGVIGVGDGEDMDFAGFPNGRRPGDDVVDIALRVAMGKLCSLGLICTPEDAVIGGVPLTDGSPLSSADIDDTFPYLRTPTPGSTGIPIQ